jgi:hypothetical protein
MNRFFNRVLIPTSQRSSLVRSPLVRSPFFNRQILFRSFSTEEDNKKLKIKKKLTMLFVAPTVLCFITYGTFVWIGFAIYVADNLVYMIPDSIPFKYPFICGSAFSLMVGPVIILSDYIHDEYFR